MNYWQTKQIHWYDYTPQDIFIKNNNITRQFANEIQTCSYKTKHDFYEQVVERQGKTDTGVCVKFSHLKNEFPLAEIDFLKYKMEKRFSTGDFRWTSPNAICYIHSHHNTYQWKQKAGGGWDSIKQNQVSAGDEEGYQVSFSANQSQFGGDRRECQEMMDISFAVIDFLVERILPLKREKDLTMVA